MICPKAQSPCCPTTPEWENSTNQVTYSCQNKKSVPFPSLQSARLGTILEYFKRLIKDVDGVAFLPTLLDCASLLKGAFRVYHVVLPCSIPVTSITLLPLKTCCLLFFSAICTCSRHGNENNALPGVKTTISHPNLQALPSRCPGQ